MESIISAQKAPQNSVVESSPAKTKIVNSKDFSRTKLVGKYPHVKHFSAPRSKLLLDSAIRKQLLASMVLA